MTLLFVIILRLPPRSTLFPYTTLFRSERMTQVTAALHRRTLGIELPRGWSRGGALFVGMLMSFYGLLVLLRLNHVRSEEHTSEIQSRLHLVCRLLLEKKKKDPLLYTIH